MNKPLGTPWTERFLSRFVDATHTAHAISVAANDCAYNFRWLCMKDVRMIPLLDFDVICASLPTLATDRLRAKAKQALHPTTHQAESNLDSEVASLDYLMGPYTIRWILREKHKFSLPPGTMIELLKRVYDRKKQLSEHAEAFQSRIESALNSSNPSSVFSNGIAFAPITQVVRDELLAFAEEFDDIKLLEDTLSCSIPLEELIDQKSERRTIEAFRSVYGLLQGGRRAMLTRNNFNDAMNVASVVQMFNNPASQDRNRYVPFLISQTQQIVNLGNLPEWFTLPDTQTIPRFFNNHLYLIIMQGLLSRYAGGYQVTSDGASSLASVARELERCCFEVMNSMPQRRDYHMAMLLHKYQCFVEDWGFIFEPATQYAMQDHTTYINQLLSPSEKQLSSPDFQEQQAGFKELVERLRNYSHPYFDLWKAVEVSQLATLSPIYTFSKVNNDGEPMRDTMASIPLESPITTVDFNDVHDIRLAIHIKFVSSGAIIAIDSWYNPEQSMRRCISVTWLHKVDKEVIWRESLYALKQCFVDQLQTKCVYSMFSKQNWYTEQNDFQGIQSLIESPPFGLADSDFFEIRAGDFALYADIEPLGRIEKQVGLAFPASYWSKSVENNLITIMTKTSEIPLSPEFCRVLIKRGMEILEVDAP